MSLCQYKDIFGIPGKGNHSIRFFGFALFDIILTIVASIVIAYVFDKNFWVSLFVLFAVGELLHVIFCVNTSFIKLFK